MKHPSHTNHYRNLFYGLLFSYTTALFGFLILGEYQKGDAISVFVLLAIAFVVLTVEFGCYETLNASESRLMRSYIEFLRDEAAKQRTAAEQTQVERDRDQREGLETDEDRSKNS